ncbi:MAG: hypothetical protein AAFQ98_16965, partial [Bacteroidota bacterium]
SLRQRHFLPILWLCFLFGGRIAQAQLPLDSLLETGNALLKQGQILTAQHYFLTLMEASTDPDIQPYQTESFLALGDIQFSQRYFKPAMLNYTICVKLAREHDLPKTGALAEQGIARLMMEQGEDSAARAHSFNLLDILEANRLSEELTGQTYHTIARTFFNSQQWDSAAFYLEKAQTYDELHQLPHLRGQVLASYAEMYRQQGKSPAAALALIDEALGLVDSLQYQSLFLQFSFLKASLLGGTTRWQEGASLFDQAIQKARSSTIVVDLDYAYVLYIDLLRSHGRNEKALQLYDALYAYKQEEHDLEEISSRRDFEARYKLNQTQYELEQNRLTLEQSEAKVRQQRRSITIITPLAILILLLLVFGFRNYRAKNRAHVILEDLMEEIRIQNEELIQQAEKLTTSNEHIQELNDRLEISVAKRTETIREQHERLIKYGFMNAHELRGPLARILGLTYLIPYCRSSAEIMDLAQKIEFESRQMDRVVKQINRTIEEEELIEQGR